MIEEPPILTISNNMRRPTTEQVAAFQGVPTGFVCDAMDGKGALNPKIAPLGDGRDLACVAAGPALTADNGPADILATLAALKFIQPGDVVMVGFGAFQGCAAVGDRVSGMMKNSGAAGLVTDGPMRDYEGVVAVGLPAWCTGLNPSSPYSKGPGTVGFPMIIGGQRVATGDMIIADRDGVVVVPFERIDEVITRLDRIRELETALDAEVAKGLKVPENIQELLDSPTTAFKD